MKKEKTDKKFNRVKGWNDKLTKLPDVTIFSIDPVTGGPYMTLDHAQNLTANHIYRMAKNLLEKHEVEDLMQELMLKLCTSKFDPTLSSAKTFTVTCMTSQCARIWKRTYKVRDKHKETSDFVLMQSDDGTDLLATECIGVDNVTPEDYLMAKETVEEYYSLPEGKRPKFAPKGWTGRPGKWESDSE